MPKENYKSSDSAIKQIKLSTLRHDLRTPVNHIIGYSELLIEEDNGKWGDDLKRICSGGRELLSLINYYFDEENFDPQKISETSTIVKLRTPVTQIIGYCELLLEEVEDSITTEILSDLKRVHKAAESWLDMMESTLFPLANGELSIKNEINSEEPPKAIKTRISNASNVKGNILWIIGKSEANDELEIVLESQGYNLKIAQSIKNANSLIQKESFDLILLSNNPVDSSPDQFVSEIAKNAEYRNVSIILITLLDQIDTVTKSIKSRVDCILSIPLDIAHSLRLINRQLSEKLLRESNDSLTGRVLVVDDDENNRDVLTKRLQRAGHAVTASSSAEMAMEILLEMEFDVILLDMIMPGMNGDEALNQIKQNRQLHNIPVIMISGLDQIDGIVRCIEMGAEDYLPKPFDPILLKARINAAIEKKQLRDQEKVHLDEIETEKAKSDSLLLNILPATIAAQLKDSEQVIANNFESVSIVFADLVGFTKYSQQTNPKDLVVLLNQIFTEFDEAAALFGIEKIKTIGDAYMAASGLPIPNDSHAKSAVLFGQEVLERLKMVCRECDIQMGIRVGIHSGPVTAGIIGKKKFIYDVWGDTVNVASRMESQGQQGRIQITDSTAELLNGYFMLNEKRQLKVKGRGIVETYFVEY